MKQTRTAPTAKELKAGPVVRLSRPGWVGYNWAFPGLAYPIRFTDGKAVMLESHFDEWIGDANAAVHGITVTRPKPKPQPKETGAKKAPAKKTATKK